MTTVDEIVKKQIKKTKPIGIIILVTLFLLMIETLFSLLFEALNLPHGSNLTIMLPKTILEIIEFLLLPFIGICILAPLLETFIVQYLFYEIIVVKLKRNKNMFIFFTAIIFGLFHYHYYSTMFIAFIMCIVFNYTYLILREIYSKQKSFFIVFLIHSFLNIFAFVAKYLSLIYNS
jgi:hypothetical protein